MKAQISASSLKRLIQATYKFAERAGTRPVYNYIRLEFSKEFSLVTAIAINGYEMSVEHATCGVDEDFTAYIKAAIPPAHKDSDAIIELRENTCYINIDGFIIGYQQPSGEFIDWKTVLHDNTKSPVNFRIGFNGNYLLTALQAAKASAGNIFRQPVILEFRDPLSPVLIKTNKDDVKMVLPVRLKSDDSD